jgi:hypothetical protein
LRANNYLHYALDLWAEAERRKGARDDMFVVQYADDGVPHKRFHAGYPMSEAYADVIMETMRPALDSLIYCQNTDQIYILARAPGEQMQGAATQFSNRIMVLLGSCAVPKSAAGRISARRHTDNLSCGNGILDLTAAYPQGRIADGHEKKQADSLSP